jgi:hypothetical protein
VDPEQQAHLERVSTRIAWAVEEFCSVHRYFVAEELRDYIRLVTGSIAPSSADRILRYLRARDRLSYVVLSRRESCYEVFWVMVDGKRRRWQ